MKSFLLIAAAASAAVVPLIPALEFVTNPVLRRIHDQAQPQQHAISYPDHYLPVPVDHFHNESRYEPHSDAQFPLRYWFDAQHYRPGGPVIVIAAGETDGTDRFPFLSQGVVTQLAKAYHGIGVILEHRYYGKSYPFDSLTTDNIRFLTTEQAVADYAYFASHVKFPGLKHHDLSPKSTPWLAYGGSYAGAFVAFLRKLYPDVYWGSVCTSGVTAAIVDYWQYYEPIRKFGPRDCIHSQQVFIDIVDRVLIDHADNQALKADLMSAFGVPCDLKNDQFTGFLSYGLDSFQSRNWDPAIGDLTFRRYCDNITSSELLYPDTAAVRPTLESLVKVAGYDSSNDEFITGLLNHIGLLNATVFTPQKDTLCPKQPAAPDASASSTAQGPQPLNKTSDVSWSYQVCTEWGYFTTGASVPADIMPVISRVQDLATLSSFCATTYGITTPPDTDRINQYGGWNFSYPRVAIIDGLADPWREATPHADGTAARESTNEEPFLLIEIDADDVWDGVRGAVHHWDQNGLSEEQRRNGVVPPKAVQKVQREVERFVGVWLKEWKQDR
ncbi:hypothetical protein FE257_001095 [Aspergillus nanangensis]|uniref:Uncharacterized protein n=1 Tax=Aspergillus nanangensis TaxID=2582783 RepID=A0AAD4GYJ5_ASPNN|nr:hypothetical protein FE257_001095 [Aspergillus nanangensis]